LYIEPDEESAKRKAGSTLGSRQPGGSAGTQYSYRRTNAVTVGLATFGTVFPETMRCI
jgi:hypothetical protein